MSQSANPAPSPLHPPPPQAVAREWFGNGVPPPLEGRLEFVEDTGMSVTHTLVELRGLGGEAGGYHVHQVPGSPS